MKILGLGIEMALLLAIKFESVLLISYYKQSRNVYFPQKKCPYSHGPGTSQTAPDPTTLYNADCEYRKNNYPIFMKLCLELNCIKFVLLLSAIFPSRDTLYSLSSLHRT